MPTVSSAEIKFGGHEHKSGTKSIDRMAVNILKGLLSTENRKAIFVF